MIYFDSINIERGFIKVILFVSVLFLLTGLTGQPAFAKSFRIKFATLAPEGSAWMKVLHKMDADIKQKLKGKTSFKFYPGGVAGDEKDVIRKMRIGQIHAAGFTGVGLGEILPEVRVLDLPFLFQNDEEIEFIYNKLENYFAEKFQTKGYILLGWVPVGWIHFFSNREIVAVEHLLKSKAWMWEGDPLVQEAYQAIHATPFPLSITDVLLSLQTGMIQTVYTSPLGALALQWFSKVKYMSRVRMGYGTGGVLMTLKKYEKLAAEEQKILRQSSRTYLKQLMQRMKQDNKEAINVMINNGLKLAAIPDANQLAQFHQAGITVRKNLTGKLFSKQSLDKVMGYLEKARKE